MKMRVLLFFLIVVLAAPLAAVTPEKSEYYKVISIADDAERFAGMAGYLESYPVSERSDRMRTHLLALAVTAEYIAAPDQALRPILAREGKQFVRSRSDDAERLILASEIFSRYRIHPELALPLAEQGRDKVMSLVRPSSVTLTEWPGYRDDRLARANHVLALAHAAEDDHPGALTAYSAASDRLGGEKQFRADHNITLKALGREPAGETDGLAGERDSYMLVVGATEREELVARAEDYLTRFPGGNRQVEIEFRLIGALCSESSTRAEGESRAARLAAGSDDPEVLSALAHLLAESDAAHDDAVRYAARAAELLTSLIRDPGTPAADLPRLHRDLLLVKDSYGWALLRAGDPWRAVEVLYDAAQIDYPRVSYHYGLALAEAGKGWDAAGELVEAYAGGVDEAVDALDDLRSRDPSVRARIDQLIEKAEDSLRNRDRHSKREWTAPDFTLISLEGEEVSLSGLKGSVVVLDFWATWCGPCKKEMPRLQRLADRYEGKDVIFLAVSADRDPWLVRPFLEERGVTIQTLFLESGAGEDDLQKKYRLSALPNLYFIDRTGKVRFQEEGFDGNAFAFDRLMGWRIDALLADGAR